MAAAMAEERAADEQVDAAKLVGDIGELLNDARPVMRMTAALLAGLSVAIALEAGLASSPLRPGAAGAVSVVLLLVLAPSWLTSLVMLSLAGRPVLGMLSNHRWRAGAPLDLRAPWHTIKKIKDIDASPEDWTFLRARLMISVASTRLERVQTALNCVLVTTALFLAWTVMVFVSG